MSLLRRVLWSSVIEHKKRSILLAAIMAVACTAGEKELRCEGVDIPTSVAVADRRINFLTMLNRLHPGNRIGYRIHEHHPFVHGEVPEDLKTAGIDMNRVNRLIEDYSSRAGVFIHRREVKEEGWVPQDWTYYLVPVKDGFELLWTVTTRDAGLNEYYAVQQCFRMSGKTNAEWRRKIAETPAFSEYDLWQEQEKRKQIKSSLTYVRRKGKWEEIPPVPEHIACRTPLGVVMDYKRTDGKPESLQAIEPYGPTSFEPTIDCGPAARSNPDGTWVCAIYWQRTTHITNHHPADCLHPIVNLGPIPANGMRALQGKIYWMKATKEELYAQWLKDFPNEE